MTPKRRRLTSATLAALVGALLSINASCHGNVDVAVTHVASYGARVSEILLESERLVVKATPSLIPEEKTAKAMVQFRQAGQVEQKLAAALAAYDALAPDATAARAAQISTILRTLHELRQYVTAVMVFVGDNGVGAQLLTLFGNLETVFMEIETGLLQWQAQAATH